MRVRPSTCASPTSSAPRTRPGPRRRGRSSPISRCRASPRSTTARCAAKPAGRCRSTTSTVTRARLCPSRWTTSRSATSSAGRRPSPRRRTATQSTSRRGSPSRTATRRPRRTSARGGGAPSSPPPTPTRGRRSRWPRSTFAQRSSCIPTRHPHGARRAGRRQRQRRRRRDGADGATQRYAVARRRRLRGHRHRGRAHDVAAKFTATPDGVVRLDSFSAKASAGVLQAAASARFQAWAWRAASAPASAEEGAAAAGARWRADRIPRRPFDSKWPPSTAPRNNALAVRVDVPTLHVQLPVASPHQVPILGGIPGVQVGIQTPGTFIAVRSTARTKTPSKSPSRGRQCRSR